MNPPMCEVCNIPMRYGASISGKKWYCENYWKCGQFKEISKTN